MKNTCYNLFFVNGKFLHGVIFQFLYNFAIFLQRYKKISTTCIYEKKNV